MSLRGFLTGQNVGFRRVGLRKPRQVFRVLLLSLAMSLMAIGMLSGRAVGQAHVDRGGTVGIQNDTERSLFYSLICMCGCPRETLGTCTCGYAGERRDELREMLGQGLSAQDVIKAYEKRFGTEALAIPPNRGIAPLIWMLPILGLIFGAVFVVRTLRRWSANNTPSQATAAKARSAGTDSKADERDRYDERLDEELRGLDNEP